MAYIILHFVRRFVMFYPINIKNLLKAGVSGIFLTINHTFYGVCHYALGAGETWGDGDVYGIRVIPICEPS